MSCLNISLLAFSLASLMTSCVKQEHLSIDSSYFNIETSNSEHIHFFRSHLDEFYKNGNEFSVSSNKKTTHGKSLALAQHSLQIFMFSFTGKNKISYFVDLQYQGSFTLSSYPEGKEIILEQIDLDMLKNKMNSLKKNSEKDTVFTVFFRE